MKYAKREHKKIDEAIDFSAEEKEKEIVESFEDKMDDAIENAINDAVDEVYDRERNIRRGKIIINIIFSIIVLLIIMVATDIICVSRFDKGPFFAIPTRTYKDGGTKEYYGLGYKVIKYNQIQGRRDKVIGKWSLKYNVNPVTIQDVDMAINFNDNPIKTYDEYYKKFVRIISTMKKVDKKNHSITIGYSDEGGKYSLDIKCDIVPDQTEIDFKEGKEITIIGTMTDFKPRTDKTPNTIYISNCFAEQ
ncbi:MAG: hypothetical protein IJI58_04920 [Bacilli bacterium]|nr:hypothetical protein [Bacilli bacterium]